MNKVFWPKPPPCLCLCRRHHHRTRRSIRLNLCSRKRNSSLNIVSCLPGVLGFQDVNFGLGVGLLCNVHSPLFFLTLSSPPYTSMSSRNVHCLLSSFTRCRSTARPFWEAERDGRLVRRGEGLPAGSPRACAIKTAAQLLPQSLISSLSAKSNHLAALGGELWSRITAGLKNSEWQTEEFICLRKPVDKERVV